MHDEARRGFHANGHRHPTALAALIGPHVSIAEEEWGDETELLSGIGLVALIEKSCNIDYATDQARR